MLALSRGEGQSIIINGTNEIKVVKWSRSSVRLAIQAPREVSVDRDEIWRRMHPGAKSPLELAEVERQIRFQNAGVTVPIQAEVIDLGEQPVNRTPVNVQKVKQ